MFDEFADIEYAAAQLGIDPDSKELWELACAFGAHHIKLPFGTNMGLPLSGAPMAGTALDALGTPAAQTPTVANAAQANALRDLIAAEEHARATGERAEWAEPSDAEVVALRPLLRGG